MTNTQFDSLDTLWSFDYFCPLGARFPPSGPERKALYEQYVEWAYSRQVATVQYILTAIDESDSLWGAEAIDYLLLPLTRSISYNLKVFREQLLESLEVNKPVVDWSKVKLRTD